MKRIIVLIGALIVSISFAWNASTASAQQPSSITISPLRQEGEVAPGSVYSGTILIKNSGESTQKIDLSAETFNVTNPAYEYLFLPNTTESGWVSFNKPSFSLKSGKSQLITYNISVPIGAEPAGYYLALFALNRPNVELSGGITPTERVASLVYLTVRGDASRVGALIQLRSPTIAFTQAKWSATLQNSGTLHYRSVYSANVTSIFDQSISYREDSRLILPASVRLVEDSLELPAMLGIYKVNYKVSLGDNPAHTETRWLLYLPPLQIALLALIIAGLLIIFKDRKKQKA